MTYAAGSANATVSIGLSAMVNVVWNVSQIVYSWSGALASGSVLQVIDGSTTIFEVDACIALNQIGNVSFVTALAGTAGNSMTIQITAGGLLTVAKLNAFTYQT